MAFFEESLIGRSSKPSISGTLDPKKKVIVLNSSWWASCKEYQMVRSRLLKRCRRLVPFGIIHLFPSSFVERLLKLEGKLTENGRRSKSTSVLLKKLLVSMILNPSIPLVSFQNAFTTRHCVGMNQPSFLSLHRNPPEKSTASNRLAGPGEHVSVEFSDGLHSHRDRRPGGAELTQQLAVAFGSRATELSYQASSADVPEDRFDEEGEEEVRQSDADHDQLEGEGGMPRVRKVPQLQRRSD